jgi:hypothetical protein
MWDPQPFVRPRSSFVEPVAPPTAGPCDPPLVCIQINEQYPKLIAGAMFQLLQRTTWTATDEDDLQNTLAWMTWATEIIGTAVQCSQPPPIPGQPCAQRACNISGYLANYVLKESISQGTNAVANTLAIATTVWGIVRFIPGFAEALPLTWLAINGLLAGITATGIVPFQTAIADPALWGDITCAIYAAILTDCQVTTANFPAIVTNITAIPFADAGVKSTVLDYINNLGAGGMQALQTGGPFIDYDCTGCGGTGPTGPPGPSPWRLSGSQVLQIIAGAFEGVVPILFPTPFDTPPLLTMSCDNQDVIGSFNNVSATGCDLRITSAVPAGATMTANLDWTAALPGID